MYTERCLYFLAENEQEPGVGVRTFNNLSESDVCLCYIAGVGV